ncbi:MAG TPA: hypothetical protein VEI97_08115 [bacterium]|nr:hypothetical protein [bacterium]
MAFRSQTTLASGSRTNSTLNKPAGLADNDWLYFYLTFNRDPATTPGTPTGFSVVTGFPVDMTMAGDTSTTRVCLWKKKVTNAAGEPASYTATHATGFSEGWLAAFSGRDGTDPNDPVPGITDNPHSGVNGSTMTAPSITTAADDTDVLGLYACWDAVGSQSPTGGTTPTFTERHNPATGGIYVQTGNLGAGTAGTVTGTKAVSSSQGSNRPWVAALVALKAAAAGGVTVTPTTASLTLTAFAPTVSAPRLCTPSTAALTLTTFAPRAVLGTVVTPATRALTLSTFAPTVSTPRLVTPTTRALTLATFAPTVSTPRVCTPAARALTLTTFAPSVTAGDAVEVVPDPAALTLATFAPTVSTPRTATPATAALTLTGLAPTVQAPRLCTPATRALTLSTFAPTVSTPRLVTPGAAALTVTRYAPTVSTGAAPDGYVDGDWPCAPVHPRSTWAAVKGRTPTAQVHPRSPRATASR